MKFKISDLVAVNMETLKAKDDVFDVEYADTGSVTAGIFGPAEYFESLRQAPSRARRVAMAGDTVYSTVRPNQRHFGFITNKLANRIYSTGFAVLHPNPEKVLPYYFYLIMNQEWVTEMLQSVGSGSTSAYPSIRPGDILNLEVEVPDLETQRRIVNIFQSLDGKMLVNNQINDNLLELALAEYRQKVETTATTQMKLDDIAKVSAGGDKPKLVSALASDEAHVPIYSNGITNEGLYGFTDAPKIFEKAVTVSARGTIGYLAIREEPYYPIVRLISVIPTLKKFTNHQLYLALTDANIQGFGTTQQQLTVPVFKSTMLPILPEETRTEIEELISPMFDMIAHNKHEIVTLSETRDSLLKKLI